jgi:tRNA pseudouridine32 synthase/23S rRNA pseudouridine746 synthase
VQGGFHRRHCIDLLVAQLGIEMWQIFQVPNRDFHFDARWILRRRQVCNSAMSPNSVPPPHETIHAIRQNIPLPMPRIVLETERILVLNKHANWSLNANQLGIRDGYYEHVRTALLDQRPGVDLYPCHRLDRLTSGCLLLAKDATTARHMGDLFASKGAEERVSKTYVALSSRKPKKKMGRVVGDMDKSRRGSWKLLRTTDHPAITTFESSTYVSTLMAREPHGEQRLYYFVVRPRTGRTHQIRVALKSLASPILGDARYGNADEAKHLDRAYLHSAAMSFKLPGDEFIQVVCPPFGDGGDGGDGVYFCEEAFRNAWAESSVMN